MGKPRARFTCQECGAIAIKWQGKCPECGSWNTLTEEIVTQRKESAIPERNPESLSEISTDSGFKISTEIEEFDRVLGGGLVPGSIVLIGGPPGIGKSTLLLQIAQCISRKRGEVLYVSGEESPEQVKMRASRLAIDSGRIYLLSEINVDAIVGSIEKMKPALVLIDSIQTIYKGEFSGAPGSVTQVRECTASLLRTGKENGITIIVVGHVTKDGSLAGPRVLEHLVDTVLYFEGEERGNFRVLKSVKNRFGSTSEVGIFQMNESGLRSLENPSQFFLAHRSKEASGSIITPVIEGTRPLLVELQALVVRTNFSVPLRKVKGIDINRLALLVAVLEKWAGLQLSANDIYLNVVGGMELDEPAIDLGLIIVVASSFLDIPSPEGCLAFGEVGLGGEVRSVHQVEKRIQEAERLGFSQCILPLHSIEFEKLSPRKVKLIPVKNIKEALDSVLGVDWEQKNRKIQKEEAEERRRRMESRGQRSDF